MSIYDVEVQTITGETTTLSTYQGKVLLIVNVASKCGLTPQYKGLEKLYEIYNPQGLEVLGFPCNQFLNQEPGSNEEILEFCKTTYNVTFPMFAKIDVNGENRHELYKILTSYPDDTGLAGDIKWNFEKFLISRDGQTVKRFRPQVEPEDPNLIKELEKLLN